MDENTCQKKYDALCADYGKTPMVGEFKMFLNYVCRLTERQYDKVLKRVEERHINQYNRLPVPSMFRKAISELVEEYGKKEEQEKKLAGYPEPGDLNPRFGVTFAFEMWATEKRCAEGNGLRKGSVAEAIKLKKALDAVYFDGALKEYETSPKNNPLLKAYLKEKADNV